jgi:hypothetical protein
LRSQLDRTASHGDAPALDARPAATVFGLDVHTEQHIALLGESRARATGRDLRLHLDDGSPPRPGTAAVLCDERTPSGSVSFRIEAHPDGGYLIWGPGYGHHLLSADGCEARCFPGEDSDGEWQRLLIAQVLPFATLLRGFEVFHASAVVIDDHAIVLLGPSGAGKTSLALELCRLGADFLADDVLALEIDERGLLAHPGTPVAGIDRAQMERLRAKERHSAPGQLFAPAVLMANDRELLVPMSGASAPVPLGALFFLDRRQDGPAQPCLLPVEDPRMLLSATFNFVLRGAERLQRLLEVCSLAATCPVERIDVNASVEATCVGEKIIERMSASPR